MFCRRVNGADQGRSEAVDRMARPAYARRSTGGLLQDGEPLGRMRPARQKPGSPPVWPEDAVGRGTPIRLVTPPTAPLPPRPRVLDSA